MLNSGELFFVTLPSVLVALPKEIVGEEPLLFGVDAGYFLEVLTDGSIEVMPFLIETEVDGLRALVVLH